MSEKRYKFDGRFILDSDNPEARLYVQPFIDTLLDRAEKAEADCKAMAGALAAFNHADGEFGFKQSVSECEDRRMADGAFFGDEVKESRETVRQEFDALERAMKAAAEAVRRWRP